ncbi:transposase [Coraliomargarita parva]|uniref:transposase n=1 Tax=Coraliomargarita parva TaxID=3014050 RepID=UPI0022B2DF45|nr:transposase [Coraliomargarita parva]
MAEALEADWNQVHLLPAQIEDWISSDHEARYIRSFVEELDMVSLGFAQYYGGGRGRPPYATRLLLRAWLYGYLRKVRSTRKLERACQEEMGFIWLCGTLKPDQNSLWRFWRAHRKQIKEVFLQTLKMAVSLDMIGFVTQAVDGTKIQAVCSSHRLQF